VPHLPRHWPRILLALLAIGYAYLFPWSEPTNNPNENVRLYMVRAMAEHGTYAIGQRTLLPHGSSVDRGPVYESWGYVNDKALTCDDGGKPPNCTGRLYAGKAPGMGFLGVPPLWTLNHLWQLLGRAPPSKPLIVWWLRFWCVVLPSILAWLWLARHLAATLTRPRLGVAVVLVAAFGSLSLTYGQMFAGHQTSGLALLWSFAAIVRAGHSPRKWLIVQAGFAAALAALIEFPAGPAAMILLTWLLVRRRHLPLRVDLGWLTLGAALPTLGLLHFDTVAFGAPWHLPYSHLENAGFVQDIAPGLFGISVPNAEKTVGSLLSPYTGLYFWAPWMTLAWLGFAGVRKPVVPEGAPPRDDRRDEALVASLVCLYFLYFQCSHSLWRGGWVIGPRYITAMVPFAAIAVARGLDSLSPRTFRLASLGLAVSGVVSITVTGLASSVSQGFPFEIYNPLPEVVAPLLHNGWVAQNPLMHLGIPGVWSALPWFVALAVAMVWLVLLLEPEPLRRQKWPLRLAGVAFVLALAGLGVAGLWSVGPGRTPQTDKSVRFLMSVWTPPKPLGARIPPELLP
jgi:hypothetical protein